MSLPLVSVVVLCWEAGELLDRAVDSALSSQQVRVEVVVVDNGSRDPATARALDRAEQAGATVLRLTTNTGFARGMNIGWAATTGDPVVLLNCDAVLHPLALARAEAVLRGRPEIGVLAPHVVKLATTGPWRFWADPTAITGFDGGVVGLDRRGKVVSVTDPHHTNCDHTNCDHTNCDDPDRDDAERVSFKSNGACPVVRRGLVDDLVATYGVGPFDPVFDTYGEDVDFAWKAWARGWTTVYRSDVLAGHVRSYASPLERGDKRGRLRINLVAERYLNAVRHLPVDRLAVQVAASVVDDVRMVGERLARGDLAVLPDVARGWARCWRQSRTLLAYRRRHKEWQRIDVAAVTSCGSTGKRYRP